MDKFLVIVFAVFSLVGISCSVIGYTIWNKHSQLKKQGIEANALVIGHYEKKQIKPTTARAVIIQYKDYNDSLRTFYSTIYTTPPMFQVGETIKIWYSKDKPNDILMEGKDEWIIPTVLGVLGIIFSIIGIPSLIKEVL